MPKSDGEGSSGNEHKIDSVPDLEKKLRNMDLSNQFDSLPDELVLKIIKMAARSELSSYGEASSVNKFNHNYVIGSLGRVSSRFKQIAQDSSLWMDSTLSLDCWQHRGENVCFQETLDIMRLNPS